MTTTSLRGNTGRGSWRDVAQVRASPADVGDYAAFTTPYAARLTPPLPARTCAAVTGLAVGALVEIDLMAVRQTV